MARFPSLDWFETFFEELEQDREFRRAMKRFDGSVLFRIGEQDRWFKIYRGRILEVLSRESEFGSTFTIQGPREEWERLLNEPRNPFGEQQVTGGLQLSGNNLEASRVMDGLNILVERMRSRAREAQQP